MNTCATTAAVVASAGHAVTVTAPHMHAAALAPIAYPTPKLNANANGTTRPPTAHGAALQRTLGWAPLPRSTQDLALAYDALQGPDPEDPVCADRPAEPVTPALTRGIDGLRIAVAGGYFRKGAFPEACVAMDRVAAALHANSEIEIPEAGRARAAAYVITASEGATLHLKRLRTRAADYDPAVRDRLIAGAMIPAPLVIAAQKFRRWYRGEVLKLFEKVDAILAPATPCAAPAIGQQTFVLDGVELPVRPNIGIYTQPISFIGLPVVAVPMLPMPPMPICVQVIAAPWREDIALRRADELAQAGHAQRHVLARG